MRHFRNRLKLTQFSPPNVARYYAHTYFGYASMSPYLIAYQVHFLRIIIGKSLNIIYCHGANKLKQKQGKIIVVSPVILSVLLHRSCLL